MVLLYIMATGFIEIPLDRIVPMQGVVSEERLLSPGYWYESAIETMLYEGEFDDPDSRFLLLDGHHRAYKAYLLGRTAILSNVSTEDEDIAYANSRLESIVGCHTIEDVKQLYIQRWHNHLRADGALSMSTLKVVSSF